METLKKNEKPVISHIISDIVNHYPNHKMVQNWTFSEFIDNRDGEGSAYNEAVLANALAHVATDNGMDANDLKHLFPAILRMMKSNSEWAK